MIDHVSIGVSNIARANASITAAREPLGYKNLAKKPGSLGYGFDKV